MKNIDLLNKLIAGNISALETEQLVEWFVSGAASEDLDSVYREEWLEASSIIAEEISGEIWDDVSEYICSEECRPATIPTHQRQPKLFAMRALSLVAACALLLCGVAMATINNSEPYVISVGRGQKANITLPDGTEVALNSASSLSYPRNFGVTKRSVRLTGEAFFEVAKDGRPFVVETNHLDITVMGTSFDVKAYDEDAAVVTTVVDGAVKVEADNGTEHVLHPCEELSYSVHSKNFTKSYIEDIDEVALWSKNQLVFRGENFEEIAVMLSRLYNVEVAFLSDEVKQYTFSGIIRNSSLLNVVEIMSLTAPVKCKLSGNMIVISEDPERRALYE